MKMAHDVVDPITQRRPWIYRGQAVRGKEATGSAEGSGHQGRRDGRFTGAGGKIRVRLVAGFSLAFLAMAAFGAVSYGYFSRMERKLVFLSEADGMLNTALEIRRYEKNYFLYHHEADFDQALTYLKEYEAVLQSEKEHIERYWGAAAWTRLQDLAKEYRDRFGQAHQLLQSGGRGSGEADRAVAGLRETGKLLVQDSEGVANQERKTITTLLKNYRPLLIGFLTVLTVIGAWLARVLIVRLVRPLHMIEEATELAALGDHASIPWDGRHRDEIDSLVQSFNNMVAHLQQTNEQMNQNEKLTSLGTLTSGVAHELNNPLNNISTSCQILLEELESEVEPYHRELLEAIDQQVSKARDIVGSLLEFARQREFELRREDLRAVVEEALRLLRGEVPADVEVRVDVPEGLALEMDKAHMVQALLNLILNSIQEMPEGGLIRIRGRVDREAGQAVLEIADNGRGIAPEVLPRIFDPFFTTKEVGRGTGLGLSITYGIVERHKGHIQAHSTQGQGALFRLTLPLDGKET